jgi:hypothetical protein
MVATVTTTIVIRTRIFAFRIVGGFNNFLLSGGGRVSHPTPLFLTPEMSYGAFFVGR